MKKLNLSVDSLVVETFSTVAQDPERAGTVRGHNETLMEKTCDVSCDLSCVTGCYDTCTQGTQYQNTCNNQYTCEGIRYSCDGVCSNAPAATCGGNNSCMGQESCTGVGPYSVCCPL